MGWLLRLLAALFRHQPVPPPSSTASEVTWWWTQTAAPSWPRDHVLDIRANFCGARDAKGRVIFDVFLLSLEETDRADWYARKHAAGLTHLVVSTTCNYPGSPIPSADVRHDPAAFRALLDDVIAHGFVPIVMMTSGDRGTSAEITGEVWAGLLPAVKDLIPYCVWVPGFETGGAWSARENADALIWMHEHLGPGAVIGFEAIPERATGASYPVEPDDPSHGSEYEWWCEIASGGAYVDVFLYETGHGSQLVDGGFVGRWNDVVSRLGAGQHLWRQLPKLCFFESVAYDYYRGRITDAQVTAIARQAKAVGDQYGVTLAYGNGLP